MTDSQPPSTPALELFATLTVQLDPVREMGIGNAGNRRIIPIIGGSASGPYLSGKVLNIGADWQTVFHTGLAELDTRYAIETDDGAVIEIINYGLRHGPAEVIAELAAGRPVHPDSYYMRTHARLETGHNDYKWVNDLLFIGSGARLADAVKMNLYIIR